MMKKDAFTLWEQEGDLERMKLFFNNIGPDLEEKERIKQLAMVKIREEEKRITQLEESSKWSEIPQSPYNTPETFRERVLRGIKSLWWRWQWKFAVPVIAIVLIVFIGQGGVNGFPNLPLGMTGKAAHSESMPQMATGSYDMANQVSPKSVAPTAPMDSGVGISGPDAGAPPVNGAAKSKVAETPSAAIAPPLPQPEPQTPPADEGLPRKITYNINSSLQVEDVNLALGRITLDAKSRGGYVVESSQNQYQSNSSAHVTLKVPTTQLEGFRGLLSDYGKVLNEQTTANDITNQYYDADTRLRSLEAQEARYLEILKEAHTVEDILKIESYLGNIRTQIEQLKGQLKLWDHEVSYSTISINLQTTPNPVNINDPWQPVSWVKTWQATQDAVLKTLSSTWNGLNYLIVGVAYTLPYLLLGGIVFGIYKSIRKYRQ